MDMDTTGLSNIELWTIVVAFFSPVVLSVINQPGWSEKTKAVVAFLYCLVVGTITAYLTGATTGADVVTTVLIVLVITISTYKGFWKPTGIAPSIEAKTSRSNYDKAA